MLKNRQTIYQIPPRDSISVEPDFETDKIWAFIDINIISFSPYFQSIKDSDKENRISEFLIRHLTLCIAEQSNGYFPYYFGKNPTQPQSGRETDIGVFVSIRSASSRSIIEFEAKRLSKTSNSKEYVCGKRGGIERLKRRLHSSHLHKCGMFGYVQSNNIDHWITKINNWIDELSEKNTDTTIHWTKDEILLKSDPFSNVGKYYSHHNRSSSLSEIVLYHYFIDLCPTPSTNIASKSKS